MAEPEARPVAPTKEGSDSNSPAYSPTPRTFFFYYFFFFSTTFSLWPWLFIAFVLSANASKCRSHTVGEIHPSCAFNLISSFSVLCGEFTTLVCIMHLFCIYCWYFHCVTTEKKSIYKTQVGLGLQIVFFFYPTMTKSLLFHFQFWGSHKNGAML